jgi:uncharacterized protein
MLLFNGVSSALLMVNADTYARLRPYLSAKDCFEIEAPGDDALKTLLWELQQAQYIVEESIDELDCLRRRYRFHQQNDPPVVTVATTMDCNLACYYCYECKYRSYLSRETCDEICRYIIKDLAEQKQKGLRVTWYGGEPMLSREGIDYLSQKLIAYCDLNEIRYTATIVSNGTMWPTDPTEAVAFVRQNRIRHIQLSFDGLSENHNKRRHYRDGNRNHSVSPFNALCSLIDVLRGHAKIYLRMNLDKGNKEDAYGLIDYFRERGWVFPGSRVYPYPAQIGPLTEACSFAEETEIDSTEFDLLSNDLHRYMSTYLDIREFAWTHYPRSRHVNCSAVVTHSVLFGPDGAMYKCPHEVGLHAKSHGHVGVKKMADTGPRSIPILGNGVGGSDGHSGPHDYVAYDPFSHPKCSQCKYLPICLGGCPKAQFEKREHYIDSFCKYWETSFEPMIRAFADSCLKWQTPAR